MAFVIFENKEQMLTWVDVTAPSSTELTELSKTYDLNHFALSACLQPDHLPKHEDIDGTHFIITRVLMPIRSLFPYNPCLQKLRFSTDLDC